MIRMTTMLARPVPSSGSHLAVSLSRTVGCAWSRAKTPLAHIKRTPRARRPTRSRCLLVTTWYSQRADRRTDEFPAGVTRRWLAQSLRLPTLPRRCWRCRGAWSGSWPAPSRPSPPRIQPWPVPKRCSTASSRRCAGLTDTTGPHEVEALVTLIDRLPDLAAVSGPGTWRSGTSRRRGGCWTVSAWSD